MSTQSEASSGSVRDAVSPAFHGEPLPDLLPILMLAESIFAPSSNSLGRARSAASGLPIIPTYVKTVIKYSYLALGSGRERIQMRELYQGIYQQISFG